MFPHRRCSGCARQRHELRTRHGKLGGDIAWPRERAGVASGLPSSPYKNAVARIAGLDPRFMGRLYDDADVARMQRMSYDELAHEAVEATSAAAWSPERGLCVNAPPLRAPGANAPRRRVRSAWAGWGIDVANVRFWPRSPTE